MNYESKNMRKYLSTIHHRSPGHKKLFAFIVSASFTLMVFGIWSLVTFGRNSQIAAESPEKNKTGVLEAVPFEEIKSNVANSFEAVKNQFNNLEAENNSYDGE